MEKSQLRRLALDFADGQMSPEAYRTRRRALIDGIVDGIVTVEREPSEMPLAAREALSPRTTTATGPGPARRWPLWLGGASLAGIVAVGAMLLWPESEQPAPAAVPASAPALPAPSPAPASEFSRTRTLVESFVARRDFDPDTVTNFEAQWLALPPAERDEARGSLWFGSLVRALRDEVKTQNALAGLSSGAPALERARRIVQLGETLGIAGQLPATDAVSLNTVNEFAPTAAGAPASPAPDKTAPDKPAPAKPAPDGAAPAAVTAGPADATVTMKSKAKAPVKATVTASAAPTVTTPSPTPPADNADLSARQWLDRRDDAELTLQLFAVNGLDRVQQLIAAHPQLPVRILATRGATPRYRVFHGVFTDESAARRAYDGLPDDITAASGGAIVKSFAAVRDDLASRTSAAPARGTAAITRRDYTLQLFASGNRSNAESLVKAFPDLALKLRQLKGDAAPFRVVYGRFDSEDAARAASKSLPAELLAKIGKPLARPMAEAGTALGP